MILIIFLTSLSVLLSVSFGYIIVTVSLFVNTFLFPLVTFCIDFLSCQWYSEFNKSRR
nr:MAG TPA: hypothetical protein [Caudoviricetes sp.]